MAAAIRSGQLDRGLTIPSRWVIFKSKQRALACASVSNGVTQASSADDGSFG